jgi:hypothetical protein
MYILTLRIEKNKAKNDLKVAAVYNFLTKFKSSLGLDVRSAGI